MSARTGSLILVLGIGLGLLTAEPLYAVEATVTRAQDLFTIAWQESLADPAAPAGTVPFTILSGPFIGWLDRDSATITWEVIAVAKVTAKPYASLSAGFDLSRIQFRSARLTGLKPQTVYRYRLVARGANYQYEGPIYQFQTLPPDDAKEFSFAVIGDTQRFAGEPWTQINRDLYADIQRWNPPLVLHLGDLVYDAWGSGINGKKGWYRLFHLMRDLRATRLLAPCLGNHDVKPDIKIWGPDYFAAIPASKNSAGTAQPPFYYSFDVGQVHFTCLCTELRRPRLEGRRSADKVYERFTWQDQLAWCAADLQATRQPWKIVFFHQPLHTVGGYPCGADFREDYAPLLDRHGVQLILSGHDHSYQRTYRIRNTSRQRDDKGSVQVISGGASNLFNGRSAKWNILHQKVNHYLRVWVAADKLRVAAVNTQGSEFDVWELPRVGQPRTLPVK